MCVQHHEPWLHVKKGLPSPREFVHTEFHPACILLSHKQITNFEHDEVDRKAIKLISITP